MTRPLKASLSNSLELDSLLAGSRALVEVELNELLPSSAAAPEKIHQAIRWSVFAGGKRFRPALLLAVGQAFDAPFEALIATACAFDNMISAVLTSVFILIGLIYGQQGNFSHFQKESMQ